MAPGVPLRRFARLQQLMLVYKGSVEARSAPKYGVMIPVLYERHEGPVVILSAIGGIVYADSKGVFIK